MAAQTRAPSTRSLQLYCPVERRITAHRRDEESEVLICDACGRRLATSDAGRATPVTGLYTPSVAVTPRRVPIRIRVPRTSTRARPRQAWVTAILPILVVVVAALTVVSIVRNVVGGREGGPPAIASAPIVVSASEPIVVLPDRVVRVANTDGQGAFVRRTPNLEDRLVPWPDGTLLRVTGLPRAVAGIEWLPVEDPAGNSGWMPAQYTVE